MKKFLLGLFAALALTASAEVDDNGARIQYVASASQTEFDYPFEITAEADLDVYVNDVPQSLTTNYTITGEGEDDGGTVEFVSGLSSGDIVTLIRDTAIERTTSFGQNAPLSSASMNREFDKVYTISQELEAKIGRTLHLPATVEAVSADFEIDPETYANKYLSFDSDGVPTPADLTISGVITQEIVAEALYPRTAAEIAAGVTVTDYEFVTGDVRRYGWSASNSGAQNATVLTNAANVWVAGGPRIHIPAGTFNLSQFSVPAGRGLIIEGEGTNATKLIHSTSGSMFVLGADNIQNFVLRDLYIAASPTTSVLLDWSGDYQAYNFRLENIELHEGSSGNTSAIAFQVVGGSNPATHQKHYFTIDGLKIFGLGTGIKIDGTTAAANDLDARGVQIQGSAGDGIWVNNSGVNRFSASIENCGDGATTYNYRITGSVSGENEFVGRLENTITPANVPYYIDPSAGVSNRTYATLSATPAGYNDVMAPAGSLLFDNGKEISNVEERAKGLRRVLGTLTTDYLLRFMLSTDTMGGHGRHGIAADGKHSWATGSNPSGWDTHLERVGIGALQATGGIANRLTNAGTVTGTVAVDLSFGWNRRLVLGDNITIDEPTNPVGGAELTFILIQDGTGGHTVTFHSSFKKAGGAYTMTAGANTVDTISFVYDSTSLFWRETGRAQALN